MIGTEAILLWAQYATTGDKRVQTAVNYFLLFQKLWRELEVWILAYNRLGI